MTLICVYVFSAAVESTGAAKAEAQSRAEAARIQGEAAVEEAKLKAEAQRIEAVCLSFSSYLSVHAFLYYVSYTHTIISSSQQNIVYSADKQYFLLVN